MYLNGVDCECDDDDIRTELIDPIQTMDGQQFLKQKEIEDKSEILFDVANLANVFSAVRNFFW